MKPLLLGITVLLTFVLSGCSTATYTFTSQHLDALGNLIAHPVTVTGNTSVIKELAVHESLRNRDLMQRQMYAESGTTIAFSMTEVQPGIFVQTLASITSREAPTFKQDLPTQPSEHPVWRTANNAIDKGLLGFGIYQLTSFGKSAVDASGTKFYGSAGDGAGATSIVGGDGSVSPYVVRPEVVRPEIIYAH